MLRTDVGIRWSKKHSYNLEEFLHLATGVREEVNFIHLHSYIKTTDEITDLILHLL